MSTEPSIEDLLARFVERHQRDGVMLTVDELCGEHESLRAPLERGVQRYLELEETFEVGPFARPAENETATPIEPELPSFDGFETIERLGGGGMGEVYKLRDRTLDRIVAAKVIRRDSNTASFAQFLKEARSMALFEDERVVRIHEFRSETEPPVIIMEHIEGFELGRLAPSLEYSQRARILLDICEAVDRAHSLGIQHRDLKPQNIMLDDKLRPKVLDFGLAGSDPRAGHLRGTPSYLAPEQIDPSRPIDARTDVYALGVIFYEVLCGAVPYEAATLEQLLEQIEEATPRLPIEVETSVPEPLQAIALRAMERNPDARYASARDMALDLKRWFDGRPVLARPSLYSSALGRRLRPHLQQIEEWLRLKLIYRHEASRLQAEYGRLEARDDDWIVESRMLSYSQIALYLGAFLLVFGSLLYFSAYRLHDAIDGFRDPLLALGLPFVGLSALGRLLYRHQRQAVAVAFYIGAVMLLPALLLILMSEANVLVAAAGDDAQLFDDGLISNQQLQLATLCACLWSAWLALRTRTVALGSMVTGFLFLLTLALLTDVGLRSWLEDERLDLLGLHLVPLLLMMALFGPRLERASRPWLARPLYVASALLLLLVLELVSQDGRGLHYLGLHFEHFGGAEAEDPMLLDTTIGMTLSGIAIYLVAWLVERRGSALMQSGAWLLFVLSPFASLEPLAYLSQTDEYARRFDWIYLALALAITILSHHRQRRSFYYAGLLNTGVALWLITSHNEWFDRPVWAVAVIATGLVVLFAGFGLDTHERTRRVPG